jgi:hypothetical protein
MYETLDLTPPAQTRGQMADNPPQSWLGKVWHFLVDALTPRYEPMIRLMTDRAGNTWWLVHDPISGKTRCMNSEHEVRIWLDRDRLHRPH